MYVAVARNPRPPSSLIIITDLFLFIIPHPPPPPRLHHYNLYRLQQYAREARREYEQLGSKDLGQLKVI